MSLRSSRRSQAAAASAAGFEMPSVPISEIRTRKWTKQPKTVGHITILKWVPDQENPTEALQKGAFRKTKGRKRPVVELGRVTRSVRQHLDAPLELLNDVPITRHSAKTIMVPTAVPVPDATNPAPAPVVASVAVTVATLPAAQMPVAPVPPLQDMGMLSSEDQLLEMAGESLFSDTVASDEQLERALDDLPFLDTDNLAMDPALALGMPERSAPPAATVAAPQQGKGVAETQVKEDAASSSSASSGEDEDEDDGDASASPMPSPSPTTSPMMSRSPSP
ncbi:hypothetical protein Poli38472_005890 [Pythium oligandrum]|uniref:Uncharacterized protein n=1 Tax=Pythium oligandrum TaxID=41045 RepID=A0A8K1CRE6_PYTOL|nr:hypothetical protein Poli38472_005890 [Pythium oligandrum]|eukprot:TMW68422.1 hypothetical protein Poli38472_005890 [Pythium oligandrum]